MTLETVSVLSVNLKVIFLSLPISPSHASPPRLRITLHVTYGALSVFFIVLYCIVLHCIALHCIALYCHTCALLGRTWKRAVADQQHQQLQLVRCPTRVHPAVDEADRWMHRRSMAATRCAVHRLNHSLSTPVHFYALRRQTAADHHLHLYTVTNNGQTTRFEHCKLEVLFRLTELSRAPVSSAIKTNNNNNKCVSKTDTNPPFAF